MSISNSRKRFQLSHKKLRRARRLYAYLVRDYCEFDELGTAHDYCARRAKEAGLYAETTFHKDIIHSLKRKHWRYHPEFQNYIWGWHDYSAWLTGSPNKPTKANL